MQCKQAYPACYMNGILMRMVPTFRYFIRDIMNSNDAVEQHERRNMSEEKNKIPKAK